LLDGVATWLTDGGGSDQIESLVEDLFGAVSSALGSISDEDIQEATDNIAAIIGSVFDGLIGSLNSEEAGSLGSQIGRIAGLTLRTFADELVDYAASDAFVEDLSGLASGIANSVGEAILKGSVSALAVDGAQERSFSENLDRSLSPFEGPGVGSFAVRNEEQFTTPNDTRVSEPANVTIEVVGDTDVIEDIVAREEERRIDRVTAASGTGFRR